MSDPYRGATRFGMAILLPPLLMVAALGIIVLGLLAPVWIWFSRVDVTWRGITE